MLVPTFGPGSDRGMLGITRRGFLAVSAGALVGSLLANTSRAATTRRAQCCDACGDLERDPSALAYCLCCDAVIHGRCASRIACDGSRDSEWRRMFHEAAPDDMVQTDGGFAVRGVPDKKITWRQIAAAAYSGRVPKGMEVGLQETAFFDPRREAWGFGTHVAVVSIDRHGMPPSPRRIELRIAPKPRSRCCARNAATSMVSTIQHTTARPAPARTRRGS